MVSLKIQSPAPFRPRFFDGATKFLSRAKGVSEGIPEARRSDGTAASGGFFERRIPGRWLRILIAAGLCHAAARAETLEVKVMEIEGRLIEATLTSAFAADRDAFDVVVGKLVALGPERGVHHLADLKLKGQSGMLNASTRDWKRHDALPGRRQRFSVGPDLTWRLQDDERVLTVQMAPTLEMAPLYRFEPIHAADGKWSLSGAVRGVRGMVMMFERVEGRPVEADAAGREWLVATLSTTRPGKFDPKVPWRAVVDSKGPGSAIIRIQSELEGRKAGKASADFYSFNEVSGAYGTAEVVFTTGPGQGSLAGSRVIQYDFEFPFDRRPGTVIRWLGDGQAKIDPKTMIADEAVKVNVQYTVNMENGVGPARPKPEDAPECYVQGMIFRSQ